MHTSGTLEVALLLLAEVRVAVLRYMIQGTSGSFSIFYDETGTRFWCVSHCP
jgi:hypothetical protein